MRSDFVLHRLILAAVAIALHAWTIPARAQDGADEPAPEQSESAAPEEPEAPEQDAGAQEEFDLDALLGIKGEGDAPEKDGEAPSPTAEELERKLTNEEAAEEFIEAIQQMGDAASRIQRLRDVGIVTQRLQEEILVKLDVLIKHAEQQGGGSSSSSASQSQSQSQSQSAPSRGQQAQQSQDPSGDQGDGTSPTGGDPEFREGRNPLIDSALASWGRLPERVRETLLQGLNDTYSSRYKTQTEQYYKKLAEDGEDR